MQATLTFNLSDPQERALYERCLRIIDVRTNFQADETNLTRFWGALSERPRRLVRAIASFEPYTTWNLAEWAQAAGMSPKEARDLLGTLGRVERSLGWSPVEKLKNNDSAEGTFRYRSTREVVEEIKTLS